MVMGGYIAHHQVHTIFQALPRQVPPDHMCHPWPISRVMSRAQNFALKSQISLPNKSLRTLWTFFPLRPIMGHGGVWDLLFFFRRKIKIKLRSCAPESVAFFLRTLVFCFSAELHYRNCVPDFCWKKLFRRNLVFRPMFRRNSTSQNV
jgi:hypothetical protein